MENIILISNKGNKVSKEELLASLQSANTEGNLCIKYEQNKPMLVFAKSEKSKLESITASVIYPMLIAKFKLQRSEAFTLAGWLSQQFGGELAPKTSMSINTAKTEAKEMLASVTEKMTKKEILEIIKKVSSLI